MLHEKRKTKLILPASRDTTLLLQPVISRHKNAVTAASFKCDYSDFIQSILYGHEN